MSHTIGELVVIALKAENIPNCVTRGSQDPFCVFKLGSLAKKTKIDKRGGQNPIWDDQINLAVPGGVTRLFFQIFHGQTSSENLISEGHVDLHEVLRKGEHDGFFPLIYNGNKAGRIYLELTFYANQVPTQPPQIRYVSHQYPNQRPPPPNARPMPPPNGRPMHLPPNGRPMPPPINGRPMPPPINGRPMQPPPLNGRPMPPPPSSNMRPNYGPSHPPAQQPISAPNHMNQRYSNVPPSHHPPPPQRQPSYHPPPSSSNSVHSRNSSVPGPQPVLSTPYHPPPMSTPRPANGYPTPRPMPPPQQHHSYNNSIPHSSQRPIPLQPQPQPYYSNQPPRQRPPF
ncbi:unnamed protein product [Cunninghamella blakesleeana]